MKKLFILLFMLSQAFAFGQIKEVSVGIAPHGHLGVRTISGKEDLLSHSYSLSKPAFHLGYGWRAGSIESLVDFFYAKEKLIDETGFIGIETNHLALYRYQGYTILQGKRVQIPIYFGFGLSYFSQPIPTQFSFDIGGRARVRIYVTNKIALYGGGYYLFDFSGTKTTKYVTNHSGLEAGLQFDF